MEELDKEMGQGQIARGALLGVALACINTLASLVIFRLLYDFLSPVEAGGWILLLSIGAYISFLDFGVSPTLSREIAFVTGNSSLDATSRSRSIRALISTCQKAFSILAAAVVLGVVIAAAVLRYSRAEAWPVLAPLVVFVVGSAVGLLGNASVAGLYGVGRIVSERLIRMSALLIGFALSVTALVMGTGVMGLAIAWLIQNVASRVMAAIFLRRVVPHRGTVPAIEGSQTHRLKQFVVPSAKLSMAGLGAILLFKTDNIIIAKMLGVAAIPDYEAIVRIITAVISMMFLVTSSSAPFFSRSHVARNDTEMRTLLLQNARLIMSATVVVCVFLVLFGERIVSVWLGEGHFVGMGVLCPLATMAVLEVHHVIHANALNATGKIIFHWAALGSGLINIPLSVVLARSYGVTGVAAATMISQVMTVNWYAPFKTLRHFGIGFLDYSKLVLLPVAKAALVAAGVMAPLLWSLSSSSDIYAFFVGVCGVAVAGVASVGGVAMLPTERAGLRDWLRRRNASSR